VSRDRPIARIHARSADEAEAAAATLRAAVTIDEEPGEARSSPILRRMATT
jgi:hypothetical protein